MASYEDKSKVLQLGLCSKVKQLDKQIYKQFENGLPDVAFEEMIFCNENNCTPNDIWTARNILNNDYHRVKRLRERIDTYLQMGCCIWLTLTFNEETLNSTTEETRRKYVRRYLKSQSNYYVANIDYGKTTEREHYHALVVSEYLDTSKWQYGFTWTERIKNHTKTSTKISKYVSKLTNHAIKESARRCAYLYSR